MLQYPGKIPKLEWSKKVTTDKEINKEGDDLFLKYTIRNISLRFYNKIKIIASTTTRP